ncbi:MAG: SUMF1/EgtB/PvdO family nonheme iron enzyme [Prevotellaceae bacterium]|nr:SUMF1/EgtB/PvdO family nonheme iron enzyme [Prevotellaceae bacterium]
MVGALVVVLLVCSSADLGGELIGVQGRQVTKKEIPPYGMVLIPQGSFNMGLNDQDAITAMNAITTTTSLDAFWIDQTEITNNEYRQFIKYVYDSVSRRLLGEQFDEFLIIEDALGNPLDPPMVNWKTPINPKNSDYMEVLNALYIPPSQGLGYKTLNTAKLVYEYKWINYDIILGKGRNAGVEIMENGTTDVTKAIVAERIPVYPDTLVWLRDFDFSYNDPFAFRYYIHPAYDDYPVVGVDWKQAKAFAHWRTKTMEAHCAKNGLFTPHEYRLPTEAEWEYAARGGLDQQMYPWGGPYTYNKQGCYLANFLPQRARYGIDGGARTLPVGSYPPNDYGLYDMAGNVAEWTITAYDEQSYKFVSAMNPNYQYNVQEGDPIAMRRKVIRGGSWKDIAYFLQCGARTFEYQDTTKSYIGFRCVRSYLGK